MTNFSNPPKPMQPGSGTNRPAAPLIAANRAPAPLKSAEEIRVAYMKKLGDKWYMQVAGRVALFNFENQRDLGNLSITTDIVEDTGEAATVRATATKYDASGNIMWQCSAHAKRTIAEAKNVKGRYLELAETGALGRLMGLIGYGTDDFEELEVDENALADSPVERR